jgi:hypothetical protein
MFAQWLANTLQDAFTHVVQVLLFTEMSIQSIQKQQQLTQT